MGLTGFVCTNTRSHRKTLRQIFKNAKNKNLPKIKRILNTELQGNRGVHILHLTYQGVRGGAHPCPSVVTPLTTSSLIVILCKMFPSFRMVATLHFVANFMSVLVMITTHVQSARHLTTKPV